VLAALTVPAAKFVILLLFSEVTPFNEMPDGPYRVITPAALAPVPPTNIYAEVPASPPFPDPFSDKIMPVPVPQLPSLALQLVACHHPN